MRTTGTSDGEHPGLRERRRRQTRELVHQVAFGLAAESGFATTTTAAISERAGISESTFFRHFPTKADAILLPYERFAAAISAFDPPTDPAALLSGLHGLYAAHLRSFNDDDARFSAEVHRLAATDPALADAVGIRDRTMREALMSRVGVTAVRGPDDIERILAVDLAASVTETALRAAVDLPGGTTVTGEVLADLHARVLASATALLSPG